MMAAMAQGPAAPTVMPVGAPTATTTSMGPTMHAVETAGALASAARKRRPTGGLPVMVPVIVPAGAPMTVATAKEPTAPAAKPTRALAPAAMKGGLTRRWGTQRL
jgi:hypothetical protein